MNTSIDAARDLLAHPTDELKATMAGANDEARSAIAGITPEDSSLHAVLKTDGKAKANGNGSARLQVVDEVRRLMCGLLGVGMGTDGDML